MSMSTEARRKISKAQVARHARERLAKKNGNGHAVGNVAPVAIGNIPTIAPNIPTIAPSVAQVVSGQTMELELARVTLATESLRFARFLMEGR